MERAMIRYEGPRGGEPSERGASPYDPREEYPRTERRRTHEDPRGGEPSRRGAHSYDPREEYPRTERRRTHGHHRMQENRARGFPNEYDVHSYQQHLILTCHREYDREFPEVVGGPSDSLGCRLIRAGNGRQPRVCFYAQPDNEPTSYDFGSQNRERGMTRFNGGQTRSHQSRRTPRNATRSHHEHGRGSRDLAGTDSAEWWAEHDGLHMRPTPNHQLIGYVTGPGEQHGDSDFVTNPYLTGRMAAVASRVAAQCRCG